MKFVKFRVGIVFFLLLIIVFFNLKTYAHNTNLGINGAEDITYDACIPHNSTTPDTTSYGEKWYLLVDNTVLNNTMDHIDDDISTIYYKIHNLGDPISDSHWAEWGNFYCNMIRVGINEWNMVYIYKPNNDGTISTIKLVNLVDVDTLDNTNGIDININIYVTPDTSTTSASGTCEAIESSEVISDRQTYNQYTHKHHTEYEIWIYPNNCSDALDFRVDDLIATGSHEIGHVLGLMDIDANESNYVFDYHHQELLMGYGECNIGLDAVIDVTYRDIAGVMITRGIHDEDDHKWLYDIDSSSNDNYKLICSVCNCVRYENSLDNVTYDIYKSCNDNHELSNGNMMPVARRLNKDFYKCKYCRYTAAFCFNEPNNHMVIDFDEESHIVKNLVDGLEYTLVENHIFNVELENGIYKCQSCFMCSNQTIEYPNSPNITLSCDMDKYTETINFDKPSYKYYKIEVNCLNDYLIKAIANEFVEIEIFDELLNKINYNMEEQSLNNVYTSSCARVFEKGTYYVRVSYKESTKFGTIDFSIESLDDCNELPMIFNENYDISEHMHNFHTEYTFSVANSGFIKISLNSNEIDLNDITISMILKEEDDIIADKYTFNDCEILAKTTNTYFNAYLHRNVVYILNIDCEYDLNKKIFVKISDVDSVMYNGFVHDELKIVDNMETTTDNFYGISVYNAGEFNFVAEYSCLDNKDIIFGLYKLIEDENGKRINRICMGILNSNFNKIDQTINFMPGEKYYIGCFSENSSGVLNISLIQNKTENNVTFITDPDSYTSCGSEVTLNHGAYRGTSLTCGYTRNIYMSNDHPSLSRLDYYWYTSDGNILTVTDFATLIAHYVYVRTSVEIMAVYKWDLTKVYKETFMIVPEITTSRIIISLNMETSINKKVQITPDNRWPVGLLQLYDWESINNEVAIVDRWGYITGINSGMTEINGYYKYNIRYIINVNIVVV